MKYKDIVEGFFISRPNRFIAVVSIDGAEETVHVKNTGRCRELLVPGARIILEKAGNPDRKTRYSLIAVYKGKQLINIDSQVPNLVAYEGISKGWVTEVGTPEFLKREVKYGASRFDLYFEDGRRRGFVEVKGVTLEENGVVRFPDAPTERGTKHVNELIDAASNGYEAYLLFVIQMNNVRYFEPNKIMDKEFSDALSKAKVSGVNILAYQCRVFENGMELDGEVPCKL